MLLPLYWRRIILPSWVVVWKHESLQLKITTSGPKKTLGRRCTRSGRNFQLDAEEQIEPALCARLHVERHFAPVDGFALPTVGSLVTVSGQLRWGTLLGLSSIALLSSAIVGLNRSSKSSRSRRRRFAKPPSTQETVQKLVAVLRRTQ